MRTTVLADLIAATGLVMALGRRGRSSSVPEKIVRIPWRYYAVAIGMIRPQHGRPSASVAVAGRELRQGPERSQR